MHVRATSDNHRQLKVTNYLKCRLFLCWRSSHSTALRFLTLARASVTKYENKRNHNPVDSFRATQTSLLSARLDYVHHHRSSATSLLQGRHRVLG
eukprot:2224764-Amphidinium_carterae.1